MEKNKKIAVVEQLKQTFENVSLVIVAKNKGLTVLEANNLRKKVKESKGSYLVAKNRLVKIATTGTEYEKLNDLFKGPTAIMYSNDAFASAKALHSFTKENSEKLEIVGGIMNNELLTPAQISHIATLPSLDELRGKLVGLLQAPASQLARVVDAYSKKENN